MNNLDKINFKIQTLGCKVNQYESLWLAQEFKKKGLIESLDNTADIYVINTCTVTQKAGMQSRQLVRQAKKTRSIIIATGCHAQHAPHEFEGISGVKYIFGNAYKHKIPGLIPEILNSQNPKKILKHSKMLNFSKFINMPVTDHGDKTRAFLKIQDGCNSFCSYCIVPYTRGPCRSLKFETALDYIERLKNSGYMEIVLSGIHLGCYGQDLNPKTNLYNLLFKIAETKKNIRIRISSIEPTEISDDIIQLIANSPVLCSHIHIPLQSGDDNILKKMNRHYSRNFFKELVLKIHQAIPDAAIGVDILSGMPGESEREFLNTYNLIKELPVTYLHVFPFSPREKTPAANFSEMINHKIIKEGCKKLRLLSDKKKEGFYKKMEGKTLQVLIEGKRDKKTGLLKGFSSNYVPVFIEGNSSLMNSILNCHIVKSLGNNGVKGKILL